MKTDEELFLEYVSFLYWESPALAESLFFDNKARILSEMDTLGTIIPHLKLCAGGLKAI